MTENQDPTATTEDVQGHMPYRKFTDEQSHSPAGDDVEGHMPVKRGFDGEDDDTEGHGRVRLTGEDDDTEGHGRVRLTGEDDDTEGHAVTGGYRPTHPRADDADDDVAGHLSGALGSQKKTEDGS